MKGLGDNAGAKNESALFFAKKENFPFLNDHEYQEMLSLPEVGSRANLIRSAVRNSIEEGSLSGRDILAGIRAIEAIRPFVEPDRRASADESDLAFMSSYGEIVEGLNRIEKESPESLSEPLDALLNGEDEAVTLDRSPASIEKISENLPPLADDGSSFYSFVSERFTTPQRVAQQDSDSPFDSRGYYYVRVYKNSTDRDGQETKTLFKAHYFDKEGSEVTMLPLDLAVNLSSDELRLYADRIELIDNRAALGLRAVLDNESKVTEVEQQVARNQPPGFLARLNAAVMEAKHRWDRIPIRYKTSAALLAGAFYIFWAQYHGNSSGDVPTPPSPETPVLTPPATPEIITQPAPQQPIPPESPATTPVTAPASFAGMDANSAIQALDKSGFYGYETLLKNAPDFQQLKLSTAAQNQVHILFEHAFAGNRDTLRGLYSHIVPASQVDAFVRTTLATGRPPFGPNLQLILEGFGSESIRDRLTEVLVNDPSLIKLRQSLTAQSVPYSDFVDMITSIRKK